MLATNPGRVDRQGPGVRQRLSCLCCGCGRGLFQLEYDVHRDYGQSLLLCCLTGNLLDLEHSIS